MTSLSVATLTLAFGLASSAFSEGLDLKNGFSLTGEVELEYAHFDGNGVNEATYAFVDLGLKWRSQSSNGFGFGSMSICLAPMRPAVKATGARSGAAWC